MTTHIEVSKRAVHGFKQITNKTTLGLDLESILHEYQPYLQAGSFFPDWGYSCANQSDGSEIAHWPPFWNASVQYFRSNFKAPYNTEAKAFIAFLFGMVSHGVADAPWHSLDSREGFIQASEETDFSGSYSKAHTNADFGGEMVLAHSSHLADVSILWNMPVDSLLKIYAPYKLNVTAFQLRSCMLQGYAGTQGIRLVGKLLLPAFASKSPFLVKEYRDYFRGGLMDMSAWVIHCWHDLERWLQDGPVTPFCKTVDLDWTPEYSKKREREFPFNGLQSLFKRFTATSLVTSMEQSAPDQVVIEVTRVRQKASKKRPHETNPFAGLQEIKVALFAFVGELASSFWRQLRSPFEKSECISSSDAAHTFEFNEPFVRFGKAMAYGDFKGDGFKNLVISAPYLGGDASDSYHTGGIFVMKSNLSGGELSENVEQIIRLPKEFQSAGQRFGYATTVVDLNCDGIDDLAVSAPSAGSLGLEYTGSVFVFFGVKGKGLSQYHDVLIQPKVKQPYHRPGQTWENRFIVLGEQLHSFDLDGDGFADLLIASPHASPLPGRHQLGQVHAFLSGSNHTGTRTLSDSDWSLSGTQDYECFGSSVAFLPSTKTSNATIFVGSSGYRRIVTDPAQGRIYGFQMRKRHSPRLKFAVASESQYSRFGGSMAVGDFQQNGVLSLAVTSPAERNPNVEALFSVFPGLMVSPEQRGFQAGALRLLNITALMLNQTDWSKSLFVKSSVFGMHSVGLFGDTIANGGDSGLWVTEPMWYQETGRVYNLGEMQKGSVSKKAFKKCYQGIKGMQRLGSSMILADINHDGKLDLVASSMNGKLEESGLVQVFVQ